VTAWYDVLGRRMRDAPSRSGVYWRVQIGAGGQILERRKVLILR
jgi:hypothetical protein